MKFGQKLIGFGVTAIIMIIGLIIINKLDFVSENFESLAKWIVIAFGILCESNVLNTVFFKNNNGGGKNGVK